ncbi:MAG: hypothetical protein AAGK14_07015 [Verrucomicrobiota bacterium]
MLKITALWALGMLPAAAVDGGPEATAKTLAQAAGLKAFGKIRKVEFTFNAQVGERHIQRVWAWWPQEKRVRSLDQRLDFALLEVTNEVKAIHAKFINDVYWLTFPFQLVWDKSATIEPVKEGVKAPLSGQPMSKLTVFYPAKGKKAPGDAYDLFFDESGLIREWIYRKDRNSQKADLTTTWEGYRDYDGWRIALDHKGQDGFRVWFTDVKVE